LQQDPIHFQEIIGRVLYIQENITCSSLIHKLGPLRVNLQRGLMANYAQHEPCPCERHIHATIGCAGRETERLSKRRRAVPNVLWNKEHTEHLQENPHPYDEHGQATQ
jgi:hypothetical protein